MPSDNLPIDPTSDALQFRIEERDGQWVCRRNCPKMPLTPDEHVAVADVQRAMPTNADGDIIVPPAAREHLDAGPGDVVSIVTVVQAHWVGAANAIVSEFNLIVEDLNAAIAQEAKDLQGGVADLERGDNQGDDDDD